MQWNEPVTTDTLPLRAAVRCHRKSRSGGLQQENNESKSLPVRVTSDAFTTRPTAVISFLVNALGRGTLSSAGEIGVTYYLLNEGREGVGVGEGHIVGKMCTSPRRRSLQYRRGSKKMSKMSKISCRRL